METGVKEKLWGCQVTFIKWEVSNYGVEIPDPIACMFRSEGCGLMEPAKSIKKQGQQCPDIDVFPENCPLWGGVKLIAKVNGV